MSEDNAVRLLDALRRLIGVFTEVGYRFGELHGLSRSDVAALVVITETADQDGGIGTVELARRIGITAPSATVLVDRLIAAGLLARGRHRSDGRRVVLTLTPAARAAGREHFGALNNALLNLLSTIPPDDLTAAADVLGRAADLTAARTHDAPARTPKFASRVPRQTGGPPR